MKRLVMAFTRIYCVLLALMLLAHPAFSQDEEKDDSDKKGKLGKLVEDFLEEDEEEEEDHGGGWVTLWGIIDPVDLIQALAHMKPGPYPYNRHGHNFLPDSALPGGIVQFQGTYFQHDVNLYGLSLRYLYNYKRFTFVMDLTNLLETVGSRTDRLDIMSARIGWDFLSRSEYVMEGQIGFRSLLQAKAVSGPELGIKFVALPGRPLVLEAESTVALLRKRAFTTYSLSLGVILWRFELMFGGQFFRSPGITIDGWKFGFRLWL